jgi:hypothetical protein
VQDLHFKKNLMEKKQMMLVLLAFLGFIVYAKKNKKSEANNSLLSNMFNKREESELEKKINKAQQNGTNAITLSIEEITDQLYKEMRLQNTDKRIIFKYLENVNEEQFKKIVAHFGKQKYSKITRSINPYYGEIEELDMIEWLKNELSEQDYKTLKNKYPNIL